MNSSTVWMVVFGSKHVTIKATSFWFALKVEFIILPILGLEFLPMTVIQSPLFSSCC